VVPARVPAPVAVRIKIPALDAIVGWFRRTRRRLATVGVGALACIVGYHAIFGANGMIVYQHKKAEYRRLAGEIEYLQNENDRLTHDIKALKTDPRMIEKEAREQLHYVRPNEHVYTLPQDPDAKPPGTATAQTH
jgi:cell division protein FtsB